jgi:hypothetical protein
MTEVLPSDDAASHAKVTPPNDVLGAETALDAGTAQGAASTKSIYLATYSSVAVFELMIRGIACMRRRSDGYINATQILKIAGIDKARRTKILEKEILTGEHEKVQGGYGKYQGTWIPLKRAQELSATYNVAHLLSPLLEFDPSNADSVPKAGPRKRPNPNAPSQSVYYKDGPGATQLAAAKGAATKAVNGTANTASASPQPPSVAGPSQQPRFISLRPPPGTSNETGSTVNGGSESSNLVFPRGTTAGQRQTLSGFATHGYLPQGVPMPATEAKTKRGADAAFNEDDGREAKRSKGNSASSVPEMQPASAIAGPSPVKDLNALGRIDSPTSALRGARAPTRLHRAALGPPDAFRQLQLDGTRFADRPQTLHEGDESERRMRAKLLQLFVEDKLAQADAQDQTEKITAADESKLDELLDDLRVAAQSVNEDEDGAALSASVPVNGTIEMGVAPPCVDLVIDDHGHTALHWSTALAKVSHVRTLVARAPSSGGANTHAGNHGGETALHRTVLVSNAYDTSTFPALLHLLAPSLHTRDYRKRTVLHHIALISSVRGRGVSARYYLACVLEYIARHQGGRYAPLVDAQDDEGETALGIVARVGNVSMVKMLLDVGARKDIVNMLGLKASDWGIDNVDLAEEAAGAPTLEAAAKEKPAEAVTALQRPPRAPVQKSNDVLQQMTAVLSDLSDVFQKELTDKEEAFDVAQAHLQSATRELALRRRKIAESQTLVAERDEARMRRQNLAKTLREELGVASEDALEDAVLVQQCLVVDNEAMDVDSQSSVLISEPAFSVPSNEQDIVKLRWLERWYEDGLNALQGRIDALNTAAQAKTEQCRKVVAMCCGVPEAKVEGMLDELVLAIESIGSEGVDLQRLAGFLSKVKEPKV